ncbi:hypothetical protein [Tolypothrix sp. VBCCA 56010]|uniref:hypothetical protein n=1 Tax=Tolypothrix sp. VBCCA 56010 TaxID=3137731 RepID=UPI003D7CB7C5
MLQKIVGWVDVRKPNTFINVGFRVAQTPLARLSGNPTAGATTFSAAYVPPLPPKTAEWKIRNALQNQRSGSPIYA